MINSGNYYCNNDNKVLQAKVPIRIVNSHESSKSSSLSPNQNDYVIVEPDNSINEKNANNNKNYIFMPLK